jgi:hypothetical protein
MNIVLLIFSATVAACLFATGGVWLCRHVLRGRVDSGTHEVLVSALFQTGGTLHAVFLAFLVVAVWQSYAAARANVAEEASSLATLYRMSTAMAPEIGTQLRAAMRDYVEAVIRDEWSIQAERGGASERARAASLSMYRVFGVQTAAARKDEAAVDSAALEVISQIQTDRNRRTLQSGESLPPIIWLAAIGSGVMVFSMSFFLFMEQAVPQMLVTSIMASTIALLLCVTYVLSHPFAGPMALRPEPFLHTLQVFTSVDAMR